MIRGLPIWALAFFGALSLGLAAWAVFEMVAAESQLNATAHQLRLLQIRTTAAFAFLGFFVATSLKFCFDYVMEGLREQKARKTLANELLAEVRIFRQSIGSIRSQVKNLRETQRGGSRSSIEYMHRLIRLPNTPIYNESIGKLGLLDQDTAALTVALFSSLQVTEAFFNSVTWVRDAEGKEDTQKALELLAEVFSPDTRAFGDTVALLDLRLSKLAGVRPRPFGELEPPRGFETDES